MSLTRALVPNVAEEIQWRVLYEASVGRFYYENKDTGEVRWEPPAHLQDVINNAEPHEHAMVMHYSPEEHAAAYLIQTTYKAKYHPPRGPTTSELFEKHLDFSTGRFYFVRTDTGETTWDAPGIQLRLKAPGRERQTGAAFEEALIRQRKTWEKAERDEIVTVKREEHHKAVTKARTEAERAEAARVAAVWREAFELAKADGEINVSWQRLGHVHPNCYNFKKMFGVSLVALRLVGHELKEMPPEVATRCKNLTALSLSSNQLEELPDILCELRKLRELNLLRNKLRKLPTKFGQLVNLKFLYLSSNRLESLPPSIGNLHLIDNLTLEANRLKRLPEGIGRLQCHTLNLNGNLLQCLPESIKDMPNLAKLTVSGNQLSYLPRELGKCPALEVLHASSNKLMSLPDSIGNLVHLRDLWLDQNNLTALPWNFFQLTNLTILNMEVNPSMCHPTYKYLVQGPEAVIAWSLKRHEHSLFIRRQNIITTMQNIFEQIVEQHEKGTPLISSAYYEPNVSERGEMWYAFHSMDSWWDEILPVMEDYWQNGTDVPRGYIKSFMFQRDEVDHVVSNFQDPYGSVSMDTTTFFRRCQCKDRHGNRRVCVPPAPGWMCRRHAKLLKMHICLEREKVERERAMVRQAATEAAMKMAETAAQLYCQSQEGKLYFEKLAKKKADDVFKSRKNQRWSKMTDEKLIRRMKRIERQFKIDKVRMEKARDDAAKELRDLKSYKEQQADDAQGYKLQVLEKQLDEIMDKLENLPEQQALDKLEEDHSNALDAIEKEHDSKHPDNRSMFTKMTDRFADPLRKQGMEHQKVKEQLAFDLQDQYIKRQVRKAKEEKEEEHRKMERIAKKWHGMNKADIFYAWKKSARRTINQRLRDQANEKMRIIEQRNSTIGAIKMAKWKCEMFEESIDVWTDKPMWTHKDTGETRFNKPDYKEWMPVNIQTLPELEELSYDEVQLDEDQVFQTVDIPYPEAEPGYVSSSSSESSWDSDVSSDESGSDEEEEVDLDNSTVIEDSTVAEEEESSLVSLVKDIEGERPDGAGGGALATIEEDDRTPEARKIVPFDPAAPVILPIMSHSEAEDRTCDEVGRANKRIARRRQKLAEAELRKREQDEAAVKEKGSFLDDIPGMGLAASNKEDKGKKDEDRPQSADVMKMAGFDPEKEYTAKEMTEMAKKAIAIGKELGLANKGLGAMTYVDSSGKEIALGRQRTRGLRRPKQKD